MKTFFTIGILTALLCPAVFSREPYGRTGLFVVERQGDPDQSTKVTARTYAPEIEPGKGKSLHLYADTNVPAAILLVAFDRNSSLVPRQTPPVYAIRGESFEEVAYPPAAFDGKVSLDLYVIFFKEGDPNIEKLRPLVTAIRKSIEPDASKDALKEKSSTLKEMIDLWMQKTREADFVLRYPEAGSSGLYRGSSFPWREQAKEFLLRKDAPTVRFFRVEKPDS